ncbi:MAG: MBL fold metallo-hydrolase, partial [Deltaproteobacteria bacterium]|nr:MBL fold metallo-hydrolase [Deltaproteobacteria bacterium]
MKQGIRVWLLPFVVFFVLRICSYACGAEIKGDAEATSHGDEAANLQVAEQETLPGFVFRQYNLAVLSHYSYLIGSGGEALIVDPARDIGRYLKDAEELGLKITRVYLTHSHADFIAGHMELMNATGAEILVNKEGGAKFKHTPMVDTSEILFGDVKAVVRTTPGHTPDGTCLYVYHPAKSPEPRMVLTGDTLFIGSVGRPDLMEGSYSSARLAALLFETWNEKLSRVPDETKIYPAHGAGSLCGVHLSDAPVSTFGEQKKVNPYFQHKDLHSFVMAVIDGLREPPQYFKHNAAMNREGPQPVDWDRHMPPALTPQQVQEESKKGAWLVDARDAGAFAAGHAPDAINIGIRGRFETWTGIMVPWGEPFILIGSDSEVREAAYRLHRIGYDNPAGYIKDGAEAWAESGLPLESVALVSPKDLYGQMQEGTAPVIVDVRLPAEWMGLRIGDVLNLPIDRLFTEAKRLDPAMPVLMVCNSAYRSSMAAGVMQQLGFMDVRNLEGGSQAWIDAGLPTFGAASDQKTP